ncbi:MAG: hypothetical protein Q4C64_04200 [Erysipelotrichia bacterium]|nr:hypothetical protein [Erysipelotrichia bacterium]
MKKILIVLLTVFMLFGCTSKPSDDQDIDLKATLNELMDGADAPDCDTMELDKDSFAGIAYIPYEEGYKAVVSEAMINAVAHCAVIVQVPSTSDTSKLAQEMLDNANPRKWICVEAEKTVVCYTDNLIVLVMSFTDVADKVVSNFQNKYSNGHVLEKNNLE